MSAIAGRTSDGERHRLEYPLTLPVHSIEGTVHVARMLRQLSRASCRGSYFPGPNISATARRKLGA
jgi:hypothetical protein